MQPETARLIASGGVAKGDVLAVAQLAGVMAAKRTPDLIPMCHPLPITGVEWFSIWTWSGRAGDPGDGAGRRVGPAWRWRR